MAVHDAPSALRITGSWCLTPKCNPSSNSPSPTQAWTPTSPRPAHPLVPHSAASPSLPTSENPHSHPLRDPFEVRFQIFRKWNQRDRAAAGLDETWLRPSQRIEVHRGRVFSDAYDRLHSLSGDALKKRVSVTFVSADGLVEAGIDGSGVFKEFLSELLREVFGLFEETEAHAIFPRGNWTFDAAVRRDFGRCGLCWCFFFEQVVGAPELSG
ncbi:hypothetical protein BC830DRAFT_50342 [Chytriomyces sp. MP71]|nr:hypothetical protein BC830DRAFT_50342 [Chytriomyces sp. MP71]